VPLYIFALCNASGVLSSNALQAMIIVSGWFPSLRFWGPLSFGFPYDWERRGAARSAPEGRI